MKRSIFALGWLLMSQIGAAGVGSSGGGFAVVCRSESHAITFLQLLDFYEARSNGLVIKTAQPNPYEEYRAVLSEMRLLAGDKREVTMTEATAFLEQFERIAKGVQPKDMPKVDDIGTMSPVPGGCAVEPLAVYQDDENIVYINRELWELLDSQSRVALMTHEAIYYMYRSAGDTVSENTRRVIGRLFSKLPLRPIRSGLPNEHLSCSGADKTHGNFSDLIFNIYDNPLDSQSSILQFDILFGRSPFSFTAIAVPVRIKKEDLTVGLADSSDSSSLAVFGRNPEINVVHDAEINDGIFAGFHIKFSYENARPMSVALYDRQGTLVSSLPVTICH